MGDVSEKLVYSFLTNYKEMKETERRVDVVRLFG